MLSWIQSVKIDKPLIHVNYRIPFEATSKIFKEFQEFLLFACSELI